MTNITKKKEEAEPQEQTLAKRKLGNTTNGKKALEKLAEKGRACALQA